ncbi:TPA: hypothetical protein ACNABU_003884 [Citrobacter amalonaticus]
MSNIDKRELLGVQKHANQHRLSRLTMEVHTDELRIMASAVESYTDELIAALEAAEKRIAELEARDEPKFVKCWSCKHDIEVLAIVDCDGYCPRCAAPIDLDDEPYAGIGVKGE